MQDDGIDFDLTERINRIHEAVGEKPKELFIYPSEFVKLIDRLTIMTIGRSSRGLIEQLARKNSIVFFGVKISMMSQIHLGLPLTFDEGVLEHYKLAREPKPPFNLAIEAQHGTRDTEGLHHTGRDTSYRNGRTKEEIS